MLSIENLELQLGAHLFKFNLQADAGHCLAIIGESGAGKSTLLNLLAGFNTPRSGRVLWRGEDILKLHPAQRPITTLFQDFNLFPHLTVQQNIGLGIDSGLRLSKKDQRQISASLDEVGLSGFENRLPAQLSGGQQQRVSLARCLIRDKPILLLDEPFSALDETTRSSILQLTANVIQQKQLCTLLVSHNIHDNDILANKKRYLYDGQLHLTLNT